MVNQKKLEDAYTPDKNTRKEKIVLGLFGLDSLVAAYLLKIQKYDLIAVTIINSWDDFPGDAGNVFSCHVSPVKTEKLKEFCHKLGIPLQIIKAGAEFKELVIEPWIADRIQGNKPKPCWNCHELRMKILHDKMKEAGASLFATGHFAKLFKNDSHHSVFVHTSGDEQHDQSAFLSRIPHDILKDLMLPLSDLSKKEVFKLAENFGIENENKRIPMLECLTLSPEVVRVLDKRIPKKFIQEGDITSIDGTLSFGQHHGVHLHTIGESVVLKESTKSIKGVFGDYSYPEKRMVIVEESYFLRDKLMLMNCHFSEEVSWLEPLKGFVVLPQNQYVECWITPKTLLTVSIELSEKVKILPGEIISVVKKKGKNAKVFLTGEIQLLALPAEENEGEQNVPKVDPVLDF